MKLNQLLYHVGQEMTLSIFYSISDGKDDLESFFNTIKHRLKEMGLQNISRQFSRHLRNMEKILKTHTDHGLGFFFSQEFIGYMVLNDKIESFFIVSKNFHIRPMLEELFVNPEFLLINVSLYDIKVYQGDYFHLEIVQNFELEQLGQNLKSRIYNPGNLNLVPYKSILAFQTIARQIKDKNQYDAKPVLVAGLDDVKEIFIDQLKRDDTGFIINLQEDFFENTCLQILDKCKNYRYAITDFYSARLKERLKKVFKSKRAISDLSEIFQATSQDKVVQLIIPSERKVLGVIDFQTGEFEVVTKKGHKRPLVDVLNELAEEVIRRGGKIQILAPHFFPEGTTVLAILRSGK